uniref:Uncharacterized protein n=1 Tax=Timspurckia oligopyrenoides TaxID=708627 RepID=A0A7S0ZJH2_9RHOD|mmetsp:Transcript_7408/g.13372  ORF Transcript_7408/g.13372 Transcript_7408/m.13372 type:complete len:199 (+) Transcript_7408:46-642(+)
MKPSKLRKGKGSSRTYNNFRYYLPSILAILLVILSVGLYLIPFVPPQVATQQRRMDIESSEPFETVDLEETQKQELRSDVRDAVEKDGYFIHVITEGDREQIPIIGDTILVSYQIFDLSGQSVGQTVPPFEVTLGESELIPCLERAALRMGMAEQVSLACKISLVYPNPEEIPEQLQTSDVVIIGFAINSIGLRNDEM